MVTRKYKRLHRFFSFLSLLCLISPIIVYTVLGFINGEIAQKVTLGITLIICLMFVGINILFKRRIRSTMYIFILGIYSCINYITPLLLVLAGTTIIDEFILTPLAHKYKNLFTINREIDRRG